MKALEKKAAKKKNAVEEADEEEADEEEAGAPAGAYEEAGAPAGAYKAAFRRLLVDVKVVQNPVKLSGELLLLLDCEQQVMRCKSLEKCVQLVLVRPQRDVLVLGVACGSIDSQGQCAFVAGQQNRRLQLQC